MKITKTILIALSIVSFSIASTNNTETTNRVKAESQSINRSTVQHAYLLSLYNVLKQAKRLENEKKVAYYQKLIQNARGN